MLTENVYSTLSFELSGDDVIKFPLYTASSHDLETNLNPWVF